jgi:hypothetical protein
LSQKTEALARVLTQQGVNVLVVESESAWIIIRDLAPGPQMAESLRTIARGLLWKADQLMAEYPAQVSNVYGQPARTFERSMAEATARTNYNGAVPGQRPAGPTRQPQGPTAAFPNRTPLAVPAPNERAQEKRRPPLPAIPPSARSRPEALAALQVGDGAVMDQGVYVEPPPVYMPPLPPSTLPSLPPDASDAPPIE